jgi:hypothetical protein
VYCFDRVLCCAPPFQRLRTRKVTLRRLCRAVTASFDGTWRGVSSTAHALGGHNLPGHDCARALGVNAVEQLREAASLGAEDNALSDTCSRLLLRVRVCASLRQACCQLTISDDGGVRAPEARVKACTAAPARGCSGGAKWRC